MENMIEVTHLSLSLSNAIVLDDISISFEKRQIHGLIGRNGSGKSMLMKCMCGYIVDYKGTIVVGGKRLKKDCDFPDSIGCIIENPGFIPFYSGYRNLKYIAEINNKIKPKEIAVAMQAVGLDPKMKKPVRKYSLGMKQRLGLAQAIMENPELLILDEPFNGLDKEGLKKMREYLLSLKENGKTIIIASHSSEDIEILCDTVCEMEKGKLRKIR